MPVAELRIPSDPAHVGLARLVVAQAARQAGVASDRVQDVKIAVDEALTNAVRAQAAFGSTAPIDISFGVVNHGFEVVVRTREVPLTAVDAGSDLGADLLDPKLSFTLIEGFTDEMSYEPEASSVRLRFVIGSD
jgi:anti-sigma regulatory factor (Ser/Thr protein kinase)